MPPNTAQVSSVIITHNEEKNIRRCLASMRSGRKMGLLGEIIVVDSQSTDHTVNQARRMGARVYVRPWPGFSAQKNWGLRKCRSEWILSLDADEELTTALIKEISRVLKNPPHEISGFRIKRHNFFLGKLLQHCDSPDYQLRLIRRGRGRFNTNQVHEGLEIKGKIQDLLKPMNHYSYPDIRTWIQKMNIYTGLASTTLPKRKSRFILYYLLINPWIVFIRMYLKRRGFLDGWHGLIYCCLAGISSFFLYAKLWALGLRR